ncbi:MAG: hypothetical protein Q9180_002353 [Flavoplaca navasiana]
MASSPLKSAGKNPQKWAYTTTNIPYDHGVRHRGKLTTMYVKKLSSNGINSGTERFRVPQLIHSQQELEGPGSLVLWSVKDGKNVTVIPTQPDALRFVVSPKAAQNKYYGLVNKQDGLCEGLRVDSKEVFFFEEFRDDDLPAEIAHQEDTARDQKERSFVATYLEVPFENDIKNQVRALAATCEVLPKPWVLTKMLTVLNKYDKDTQNAPGATFSGLHRAFSKDLAMQDHDREKALEDILVSNLGGPWKYND